LTHDRSESGTTAAWRLGSFARISRWPAACSQASAPTQPTSQHISVLDTTGRIHIELATPHDADSSDDFVMILRQYALSYNRLLSVPNWMSWNLNADWIGDVPWYGDNFIT